MLPPGWAVEYEGREFQAGLTRQSRILIGVSLERQLLWSGATAKSSLHDNVKLLSATLGIQRDVITTLHTDRDLEYMARGDIGLVMFGGEADTMRTVRYGEVLLEMPWPKWVHEVGQHIVVGQLGVILVDVKVWTVSGIVEVCHPS